MLVGERSGLIRFYDLLSMSAFMSVECNSSTMSPMSHQRLCSIDWSASDITRLDVLTDNMWNVFDTSSSWYVHYPTSQIIS